MGQRSEGKGPCQVAMVFPSVRGKMQMLPQQELRGHSFLFICLGIYKSLTWYNDLIKRKQNTQKTDWVSSLTPILPKRHTHLRRGLGGLLPGHQSDTQKARILCEQEEGPLPPTSTWGCGLSKTRPLEKGWASGQGLASARSTSPAP